MTSQPIPQEDLQQSPTQTLSLLRRTIMDKTWWHIEHPDDPNGARMAVLLDASSRKLIFEMPYGGPPKATSDQPFVLTARVDRVPLELAVSQCKPCEFDGEIALECSWPNRIAHLQRRQCFRIKPPKQDAVHVAFWIENDTGGEWITCAVQDISVGGLCFLLPEGQQALLNIEDSIQKANLFLPELDGLRFSFDVRRKFVAKPENGKPCWAIGIIFTASSGRFLHEIEQYVTRRQREGLPAAVWD